KLVYAKWNEWPLTERQAVLGFFEALLTTGAQAPSLDEIAAIEQVIEAFEIIGHDPSPQLDAAFAHLNGLAVMHLINLAETMLGRGKRTPSWGVWLTSGAIQRRVEDAFFASGTVDEQQQRSYLLTLLQSGHRQ